MAADRTMGGSPAGGARGGSQDGAQDGSGSPAVSPTLSTLAERARVVLQGPVALPRGTPLVAACSGGADSVALVYVLALLRDAWPLAGVAFIDHGLRDVSADREAAQAAAREAGVTFAERRLRWDAAGPGKLPGNLQARAREARYKALGELADRLVAQAGLPPGTAETVCVATGHTRTDQAETVLQRVVRGAGLRGLAGVTPRVGRVVRPLLTTSRAETRGLGLPFADDPTNASDHYLRNRLRQRVLPALRGENPRVEEALAALSDAARGELELVDALAALVDPGADLRGAPRDVVEALVRWRHRWERGGPPPPRAATRALAARLVQGGPPGRFSLGGGLAGGARRGRMNPFAEDNPRQRVVVAGPGHYRLGPLALEVSLAPSLAPPAQAGVHAPSPPPPGAPTAAHAATFDHAHVAWPLVLRRASATDAVALGGGRAVAVVGDAGRAGMVLVDAQGRVLWAPGIAAAGFAATGPQARTVLRVRLTRGHLGGGPDAGNQPPPSLS